MSDPTPAMKQRCEAWLSVLDHVETYLKAAAQRYDGIYAATARLSREMPQPTNLDSQFAPLGKGGIQDLFAKLWWDLNLPDGNAAENASNVIKNELLRDVQLLRVDLNSSIKDFDDMSSSFTTGEPIAPTKTQDPTIQKRIKEFERAVNSAELGKQPEVDPYILKLQLDHKIDSYSKKHSKQNDSYSYVQDAAKQVEGEVTERLQGILRRYTEIVEQNAHIIAKGAQDARSVFVNQPKLFEYKHWLTKASAPTNFVGTSSRPTTQRETVNLRYPKEDSNYAKAIRVGTLERRAKFLHTYSAGEYVLTPLSLIEIRQNQPAWSIDLVGAKLLKEHKAAADADQFVIQAKQHGSSSGKLHSFVFRAKVAANWIRDLENVTATDGRVPLSSYESARASAAVTPVRSPAPAYEPTAQSGNPIPEPAQQHDVSAPRDASVEPIASSATSLSDFPNPQSNPLTSPKTATPAFIPSGVPAASVKAPSPANDVPSGPAATSANSSSGTPVVPTEKLRKTNIITSQVAVDESDSEVSDVEPYHSQ